MKNDTLKKLTEDTRKILVDSIASKAISDFMEKTKAASDTDSGTFRVIISTGDQDRQGDSVNQMGWDLSFFKSNPVVLWAHDYSALPVAVCTMIEVQAGRLVAEGKFAPAEANPFAQQVRKLYDLGILNTTSVGFIPKEFDPNNSCMIIKQELLEFSFVPVPANPYAVAQRHVKELNIDAEMLRMKGITLEIKEDEAAVPPVVEPAPTPDPVPPVPPVEAEKPPEEVPPVVPDPEPAKEPTKDDEEKAFKKAVVDRLETIEKLLLAGNVALGIKADGDSGVNGDDAPENKRSKTSKETDDFNAFIEGRAILRAIDNSVEKALRIFNEAARNRQK